MIFLLKADGKQFKRKVKLHQNTALAYRLEQSSLFSSFSIKQRNSFLTTLNWIKREREKETLRLHKYFPDFIIYFYIKMLSACLPEKCYLAQNSKMQF